MLDKHKWMTLGMLTGGLLLGWSLAYSLRDYPMVRLLWILVLGVIWSVLWALRERL